MWCIPSDEDGYFFHYQPAGVLYTVYNDVAGGIRRNVPLQHFTEDDEYLRIVSR